MSAWRHALARLLGGTEPALPADDPAPPVTPGLTAPRPLPADPAAERRARRVAEAMERDAAARYINRGSA